MDIMVAAGPWKRHPFRGFVALASVGLLIAAGLIGSDTPASAAACSPNPVVCENQKTGTDPEVWDIDGAGDDEIQGFTTDMSVNVGETVKFKIQAQSSYTITIFRMGYYNGDGARQITQLKTATGSTTFPAQNQNTQCVTDDATQIYDCGTWAQSATWAVPATSVSGVYFALLEGTNTEESLRSHVTFVVRDDASTSDVIFKTSDATWQAYNTFGGSDFYGGPQGRATKISYNRPFATRGALDGRDFVFSNEYPAIRFLERNGYDVSYMTDIDADRHGNLLTNHKAFLSVGHDEYWSGGERANVEAARDAGVNLAFLSGNEVYWRTRWETSKDGANTAYRTLVCYKETWDKTKSDPTPEWTGTWRDPTYSPPSNGGRPENQLTGTMFMSNSDDLNMTVPKAMGKLRIWRGSGLENMTAASTPLGDHTVGYESDEDLDNGFRPAGLIRVSQTTGDTPEYLTDFGKDVVPGTTTHNMTLYKAASGALVFGAGTIQFAWGLDDQHDSSYDPKTPVSQPMQQMLVNLLADMHVQPATRMSNLRAASASTDVTGPTTTITAPAAGSSVANGAKVTVTGTATDTAGQVGGVEVSLDNGTTWHPAASGTTSWSYSGYLVGDGVGTIKVRSTDDSANIGPVATRTVTLTGSTSLFGGRVPATPATTDASPTELGVKVVPQTDGFIKGIRFYKGTGNTGTHTGTLWSVDGDLLASGSFGDESTSGWQTMTFENAVPVIAGNTYVASYTAPNGHFAADPWAFVYNAVTAPPLSTPRSADSGGNGVYGDPGEFPVKSYGATNYYVDVMFDSSALTPPTVTTVTPTPNAMYVPATAHPTATFSKPVNAATVQFTVTANGGGSVAGSVSYDATTKTATFTPSAALAAGQKYTASAKATDTNGNVMAAPQTWSFTTDPGTTTISTLFSASDTPDTAAVKDSGAISVGTRFTPSTSGAVIGVRFWKGTGNGGTHTGSLFTAAGTRLATATFVSESSSGWQTVYFASPVQVTAGTGYVASYYAPRGNYASSAGFFNSTWTRAPLSAPGGSNGVYHYGSDTFPDSSWNNTNYWVDPLFVAAPPPQQPTVPSGAVTVFPQSTVPANPNWNDPADVEVGMKFTADVAGKVNGVRFYKGEDNGGVHSATLWTAAGGFLASGSFVGESATGWQTMLFAAPVSIDPDTPYVVSYSAPAGHYAVEVGGLQSPVVNAPLRTVAGGGSYVYGGGFPANAVDHNYYVDVVFTADN
ncbi:DUF4082 domain-containing protein [Actinoplanes sp. TBRC 11911]|uniref:DUF4082 domain-containing protein n=1 Tax=Actinoplanes sp. TBRC 11911 TaxID=2729386 RepID=UPI00145C6532|nr:DUF4082 domain-containing protein [Actinoplanes sp. TBRC 11911]NMO49588.1 DUF4082 domain-containing protein [Actinoplanes sp. TBRC 11911]